MSKLIAPETEDLLRQPIIQAIREAAKADNVSLHVDALALFSQPRALFVNAPIAGIEKIDFKAMLDGRPVLDDISVMYWHLAGRGFDEASSSIPAGFYTVVAHQRQGRTSLMDARGKTVADGDLSIGVDTDPSTGTAETKVKVSGGVDSIDYGWGHIKLCGHVKVADGKKSVTISGCFAVSL
jgi:hypothetical protein